MRQDAEKESGAPQGGIRIVGGCALEYLNAPHALDVSIFKDAGDIAGRSYIQLGFAD